MRVCVFASGSGGNCLLISHKSTNILVDAGISIRRIEAALSRSQLSMGDITGVLITHEHSDHISALRMIAKKYDVPLCAPHTVAARIVGMLPETGEHIRIIPVGEIIRIGELAVKAFYTSHDTDESVGYRVSGDGIFAIATDTGCVTEEIWNGLAGADTVLIESNHDEDMLRWGPYPAVLKRRILSEHGHLSNEDCARLAGRLAESGTGTIVLGHLSKINNTPQKALEATGRALCGTDAELFCAPELGYLELQIGEKTECLP
ncbi:MAG: MBL fold metallo-hydrolase [Eubacteriales bacterium]|nr:MBL fold metallo-hydrolase [Eubacteriales bacterium]